MSNKKQKSLITLSFHDIPFVIFFCILIMKSILFIYISYKETPTFSQFFITFLPYCGVILVLLSISLFVKKRIAKITYLFVINLVLSVLYIIHSLYFRYFDDFASVYNLRQISMLSSIIEIIIRMIGKEFFFIADLLLIPILFPWLKKQDCLKIPLSWTKSFGFFLLLGLLFNTIPLSYNLFFCNHFKSVFERKYLVWSMGIVTYQVFDIYSYLRTQVEKSLVTQADIELVQDSFKKTREKVSLNQLAGIGHRFNLFVIQVESLQNFVIGVKWKGNEITPNLNRLAETGIYFNELFDQTWAGNTSDATFLANCSLYPSRRGAASFLYAQNSFYCLPKILEEHGYTTATMHAYKGTYWNRIKFEKALGFKLQFYKDKYLAENLLGWGLSDKEFFSQSVERINNLRSPFYAFLVTLTTHTPFDDVTVEIDNFPLGNVEGTMIGHYLRSMHYIDSAIGEFLQRLSGYNLVSNSIIVIYGDHHARFEENDLKLIGIADMNELRKIPLIINIPNRKLGYKMDIIGGLIDVAPTVSNILSIDVSDNFFMGRDLLSCSDGLVIFRDGSYISKDNSLDGTYAQKQLMISDLLLEKNLISILKKISNEKP